MPAEQKYNIVIVETLSTIILFKSYFCEVKY